MTPLPDGKTSIDERLARSETDLDTYEQTLGLPSFASATDSPARFLSITERELKGMSASDAGEASFLLAQLSFSLQRSVNREQRKVRWAEENIKHIIAPTLSTVTGYLYEERRMNAIRQNDAAMKLEKIRVEAMLRVESAAYLSNRADGMSRSMIELQKTKRGERG